MSELPKPKVFAMIKDTLGRLQEVSVKMQTQKDAYADGLIYLGVMGEVEYLVVTDTLRNTIAFVPSKEAITLSNVVQFEKGSAPENVGYLGLKFNYPQGEMTVYVDNNQFYSLVL